MNEPVPNVTPELLQQHPLLIIGILLLTGVFLFFIAGSLSAWTWAAIRWFGAGKPLLSVADWTPRKWGLVEIIAAFCMAIVMPLATLLLSRPIWTLSDEQLQGPPGMALSSGSYLLIVAALVVWICLRYRLGPSHIGFTSEQLPKALLIGLVAGLMMIPLVYLGNVLTMLTSVKYEHPLIDSVTNDGTATNYLLAVFAAAICAPIAEEFLFRGLIQGWLQSIPFKSLPDNLIGYIPTSLGNVDSGDAGTEMHTEGSVAGDRGPFASEYSEPPEQGKASAEQLNAAIDDNPFAFSERIEHTEEMPDTYAQQALPPIWPSFVTGILFGLAHWGYGLSFIPLSLLGIGLGIVYRATHSIWPCILIHFMLNGTSMLALGVTCYLRNVAPSETPESDAASVAANALLKLLG
ncbi:MAG TPA: hypothetical protein DDW52_20195 [Planctomycetaceae bacterium]|nr:hypothetical protein [Planctomycetaceae bacterium]